MGYFRRKLRRGVCLAEKLSAPREAPAPLREWMSMSVSPPAPRPCRYVRLTTESVHEASYQLTGVFAATYELLDSARLTTSQIEYFDWVLDWFHDNLRIP